VYSSDTDRTPFDVGAYASSTTYLSGRAVKKCALKIKDQILGVAVEMMNSESADLFIEDAVVYDKKQKISKSYGDICCYALYDHNQFQIQAEASEIVEQSPPPFMCQAAEVEVDTKTGAVKLLEMVSAVDCGQAINPQLAEGQVEGATVNGIAYAMTEEYIFSDKGNLLNKGFKSYKIPTAADIPIMKSFVVESHENSGPFGAKSVSEIGINGPMPAIANAIYDAIGVRMYAAPFTPEKVYRAMQEQQET
jgi:CO/xanthine dehydrogenase Mo-binding subunit